MQLQQVIEAFQRSGPSRRFCGRLDLIGRYRGDHNLNPDMAPRRSRGGSLRPAAVLVPLIDRPEGTTVMLTRRTDHLTHHPGQISFPGGRLEPQDGGAVAAALRETQEEVGLAPTQVRLLGLLDDYITRTGFVVTPVVGVVEPPFDIAPDPEEVADVFEVPLAFLADAGNRQRHSRHFEGRERYFYAMPYLDYFIWGATAGMLVDLQQRLERALREAPFD